MIIATLAFTTFITNNPGFAAWLIGGLFTIIAGLIVSYWTMIHSRLVKLEQTDSHLVDEVEDLKVRVGRYEEHVGAGDRMFEKLMNRVERHMTEEEDQVWNGISELSNKLTLMHEDNLKAHAAISERLTKVETKMPNGELTKLITMVQQLVDRP